MKKAIIIVGVIIIVVVIGASMIINKLDQDVEMILEESITDQDTSVLADGVYRGEYSEALMVNAIVEVTLLNGEITSIEIIEHNNGQGEPAEEIINDIIVAQSIEVDDIAGATYSSRVLKLAVQNALEGNEWNQ